MHLDPIDRMNCVLLARTIAQDRVMLEVREELTEYIRRLNEYKVFTVNEIANFTKLTSYRVRKLIQGQEEVRARSGVEAKHLDHIVWMISSPDFSKQHIKSLYDEGATLAAVARVTGHSETTLRRWVQGD